MTRAADSSTITRRIDAPPETVYAAWTGPAIIGAVHVHVGQYGNR